MAEKKNADVVYAYDDSLGLVKIRRTGLKWRMYPLIEIEVDMHDKKTYLFSRVAHREFRQSYYLYPPYDKKDVSSDPGTFFDDVKRMRNYQIRMRI